MSTSETIDPIPPCDLVELWLGMARELAVHNELGARAFNLDIEFVIDKSEYLVAALTIASTFAYLVQWLKHLEGEADA